jgi:hypothetical protein
MTGWGAAPAVTSGDGLSLVFGDAAVAGLTVDGKPVTGFSASGASGFLLEDVGRTNAERAAAGAWRPSREGAVFEGGLADAGLSLTATARALPTHIEIGGELRDDSGGDRAIVLTFALPLEPAGWTWDDDIRSSRSAGPALFLANTLSHGGGGGGDLHSIYPFSCLRAPNAALCWGIPLDRPIVCRMAYNGARKRYEIAFDLGLSRATAKFPGRAAFSFILYRSDPAWGFRAATRRFYDIYPASFTCRPEKQGIWMPFARIGGIEDPEDFGFMFQEGAPEVAFDDKIGVYDFVYVEPWSIRLYLPPTTREIPTPRAVLTDPAVGARPTSEVAIARSCAVTDKTGEFQTRSYLTSWAADSRVYDFMAIPDPEIPGETKAAVMDRLIASRFEEEEKKGAVLDGVYFDAFGEWTGQANYRKELWATADFPLGISRATRRPVQIYAFGVYEYVAHVSRMLHPKGKMLMANGYIYGGYPFTAHWLDVGGNEIHWERQGTDPSFFDYRRTLAYRRPCLLLNNENFDVFKCDRVEEYFRKSLLWGFFPSMFSPGASSFGNFWQTPDYHNRERALFRTYIPLIRRVAEAGWEPVTRARATAADVMVERFGSGETLHLTCHNPGRDPRVFDLALEIGTLAIPPAASLAADLVSGRTAPLAREGGAVRVAWTLDAGATAALWIATPAALEAYWTARARERLDRARTRLLADRAARESTLARMETELPAAAPPGTLARTIAAIGQDFSTNARATRWEKAAADFAEAELFAGRAAAATRGMAFEVRPDARVVKGRRSRVTAAATFSGGIVLKNCSISLVLPQGYSARTAKPAPARFAGPGTLAAEFLVQAPFTAEPGTTVPIRARFVAAGTNGPAFAVSASRAAPVLPPCALSFASTEDPMAVDLTIRNHAEDVLQGYVTVKAPASWTAAPALHDIALKPREERVERLLLRGSSGASGIYTIQASMTDLARLPIAATSLDLALVNPANNRAQNAGFEDGVAPPLPAGTNAVWSPSGTGYALDTVAKRSGARSIVCVLRAPGDTSAPPAPAPVKGSASGPATHAGASCNVELKQTKPRNLFIAGWSKAEDVTGMPNSDYSVYADVRFQDGTSLYGQAVPFSTGTHGWEQKSLLIHCDRPVARVSFYALFRNRTGRAWFDDFHLSEVGD